MNNIALQCQDFFVVYIFFIPMTSYAWPREHPINMTLTSILVNGFADGTNMIFIIMFLDATLFFRNEPFLSSQV